MSATPAAPTAGIPPRGRLLRVLGVGFGLAISIGNTIGGGLLRTPGTIAANVSSRSLYMLLWLAGGLYAQLGAVSVAELATAMPQSGGFYVYARRAFGDYVGFIAGWSDFFSQAGTIAAVSIIFGEYLGALLPRLHGSHGTGAALVLLLTLLQLLGIKISSKLQDALSAAIAIAFLVFFAAAFTATPNAVVTTSVAPGITVSPWIALLLGLQAVIYTYDGWYGPIYFGEEMVEPSRNMPRSMLRGVATLIIIYLLVNASIVHLLPMGSIAGQDLAIATAATRIFGAHADAIIRSLALLVMVNGINAWLLIGSRILLAMSRDAMLPPQLAYVGASGTPALTLVLTAGLALLFALTGSFESVLAVMAFFFVLNYAIAYAAVFRLRGKEPAIERPYRVAGFPWTTGAALLGSIAFLAAAIRGDTSNSVRALWCLAASVPAYLITAALRTIARRWQT